MLLVTGPPGSGKTSLILDRAKAALRARDGGVRLLTPTATMAEHFRNRLAREGLVFRPGQILTLSKFVEDLTPGLRQVSPAILQLIVEAVLDRDAPAEFREVAGFAGFRAALTGLLQEFSLAGCDAARVGSLFRKHGVEQPYGRALAGILGGVEAELSKRGLVLRAGKLRAAAERIGEQGLAGIDLALFDGFTSFSDLELAVLRAISARAEVVVTLPDSAGAATTREKFLEMGFPEQTGERRRARPAEALFVAPTATGEAEEIARRILSLYAAGRAFREIGVVLRSEKPFAAALRSAFDRFGIPARFYFSAPLDTHPVALFLAGVVDALLGGWEHGAALAALRACPGSLPELDRFDYAVRAGLPAAGLSGLKRIAGAPELIGEFEKIDAWRSDAVKPAVWARRIAALGALVRPAAFDDAAAAIDTWRSQAWALRHFAGVLEEGAASFESDDAVPLSVFWKQTRAVLEMSGLRVPDHRRDVVHVMDASEARQWELPVVFVCGLLEKQFPKYHSENALLGDRARDRLNKDGLRLRTSEEMQREERFLFEIAASRATELLVFSYPRCNAQGEENLRSFFLEERGLSAESVAAARPRPRWERTPLPKAALLEDDIIKNLSKRSWFGVTSLEAFLRCPFQFFGAHTLRLEEPPPKPSERFDALLKGSVIHKTIQRWHESGGDIAGLLDPLLDEALREVRVTPGFRTEFERLQMRRVLRMFAEAPRLLAGWKLLPERKVELALRGDVTVTGQLDRCETGPAGEAVVVDYKYSGPTALEKIMEGHKAEQRIQASLYLLALTRELALRPAGFFYWCLNVKGTPLDGWHAGVPGIEYGENTTQAELNGLLDRAERLALAAVDGVRAGRIDAQPSEDACRYCAYFDVCRTRLVAALEAEAGGDE